MASTDMLALADTLALTLALVDTLALALVNVLALALAWAQGGREGGLSSRWVPRGQGARPPR